jgi:mannose-6-phosphate isomerase-like protein (cupin superfamily)
MKKINLHDVPEDEQSSPHKKYRLFRRHVSVALGGQRDVGPSGGGHPFDIEMTRIPAGASNFPLHQHSAQWESYIFLRGQGEVTDGTETVQVQPDDVLLFPPNHAHKITNTGTDDLVYFVIADNPSVEITFYPDTQKWGLKPQRKFFHMRETDYFEPGD